MTTVQPKIGHISFSDPKKPGQVQDAETGEILGVIYRTPFPLGGWYYESRDLDGRTIYAGNQVKEALSKFKPDYTIARA